MVDTEVLVNRGGEVADAAEWLRRLQTKYLRTGLSWADSFRPGAQNWFDSQMRTLEEFTVTLTLCFTPEHLGESKHHTSPPKCAQDFADFALSPNE